MGGAKSKFFPTIATGTPLSNFVDSIVVDVKSLAYPSFETNLCKKKRKELLNG